MTTWAEHLAGDSREWLVYAKIEGVGRYLSSAEVAAGVTDGRYRFCLGAPDYAGTAKEPSDLWRPVMSLLTGENEADLPDLLAARLDPVGGVADDSASLRLELVDADDFLTGLLTLDAASVCSVSTSSTTATTVFATDSAGAGRITAGDVMFLNGEAMRVTARPGSSGSSSIDVERAYLGTTATTHDVGTQVYLSSPFLAGRQLELYVGPLDGIDASTEQLVGRYVVDGISWDESITAWALDARSEVQSFDALLPGADAWTGETLREQGNDQGVTRRPPARVAPPLPDSAADAGQLHVMYGSEIWRVAVTANAWLPPYDAGEVAGTKPERFDFTKPMKVRQVLVPDPAWSDFKVSPGPSPATTRAGAWTDVQDPVSILLCILTSSRFIGDGLELTNYVAARGNYSYLPSGFGMGVPAASIDWDSFEDVRARLPDVQLPNLVLGAEPTVAKDWLADNILRPLQLHLIQEAGVYRLVKIRAPLTSQASTQVDADVILANGRLPDVSLHRDYSAHARSVEYLIGPGGRSAQTELRNPTRTALRVRVDVPGGNDQGGQFEIWQGLATSLARRGYRPRDTMSVAVDASAWAIAVGDLVEVTLPEAPDLEVGSRGWTARLAQCIYREPRMDTERGVWLQLHLRIYNDGQLARAVCPAAWVAGVSSNTATVDANRFTESDATGGLPTTDAAAFEVDDVVRLVDPDGTDAGGGGTQVVQSISGHAITLDGDFSGNLAVDTLLVFADADDADSTQFAEHAWLADGDHQVGANSQSPTYYEEA